MAKMIRITKNILFIVLVSALLPTCNSGPVDSDGTDSMAEIQNELYVLTTQLWQTMPVPVCWENDQNNTTENTQRAWVRDQIERTWSFFSGFDTGDWGHCASSSTGIRIRIGSRSDGPGTYGLGNQVSGRSPGIDLDFTFTKWNFTFPDGSKCTDAGMNEICIRAIAVHEFGHLMGFSHEQNRPDTPASCTQPEQGTDGDTIYGAWDLYSIMNYCSPNRKTGELSDTDKAGAQAYYGIGGRYVATIFNILSM